MLGDKYRRIIFSLSGEIVIYNLYSLERLNIEYRNILWNDLDLFTKFELLSLFEFAISATLSRGDFV